MLLLRTHFWVPLTALILFGRPPEDLQLFCLGSGFGSMSLSRSSCCNIDNAKTACNSIGKYKNEKSKNNKRVRTFSHLMKTTFRALAKYLNML